VEVSTTDEVDVVGVIPTDGRASLPFVLLHGESLVAVAAWALGETGAQLLDFNTSWPAVQAREALLVVHDPLCPATPVAFLREAIETAAATHSVVVGVRPVTDTVKAMAGDLVGATVDREDLVAVASPLVLPAGVVASLEEWPSLDDLPALVSLLRGRFPVFFLEAPVLAGRVSDESDVRLLEAMA
jgi:2-C-methyl-D-erythritol 4-phosphate cytidylyltransferase